MGAGWIHLMAALEGDLGTARNLASCLAAHMIGMHAVLMMWNRGPRRMSMQFAEKTLRWSHPLTLVNISTIERVGVSRAAWIIAWVQDRPPMSRAYSPIFMISATPGYTPTGPVQILLNRGE